MQINTEQNDAKAAQMTNKLMNGFIFEHRKR